MSVIERESTPSKAMAYALRSMEPGDVEAAAEIEHEAFPTLWPPTSFRRELYNRLAKYLVAWQPGTGAAGAPQVAPAGDSHRAQGLGGQLLGAWRRLLGRSAPPQGPGVSHQVVGFVGIWFMADEAHITAIATRASHRGLGIGELLLIGSVEAALLRGSRVVTLEVRVNNQVAQGLYRKYGFQEAGVRKGYYADNREDALIMTTPPIASPDYQARFQKLVEAHQLRWGLSQRVLVPHARL